MPSLPSNFDPHGDSNDSSSPGGSGKGEDAGAWIPEGYLPELPAQGGAPGAPGEPLELAESEDGPSPEQRAAILRGRLVAQWVHQLERQSAPFSLEGLVVAALNPGHRQQRAAGFIISLDPVAAPQSLDARVAESVFGVDPASIEPAPAALDDLVEERLDAPEATLVKGMAERLEAVPAPQELGLRLQRQIDSAEGLSRSSRRSRWAAVGVGLAVAAGLFLMIRLGSEVAPPSTPPGAPLEPTAVASSDSDFPSTLTTASGLTFQVTYVDAESMTASDRALLGAMGLPAVGGT